MKIDIRGPIISDSEQRVYDYFKMPATSPSKVKAIIEKAVKAKTNELVVIINSGGGSVFSASEIWTALKSFKGNVRVQIESIAASAASVIAMAGTVVEMSPTAQMMIHNARTSSNGDYRQMNDTSNLLKNVDETIINAYMKRTNKARNEVREMMNKTTWMTAQQAKEYGFIDVIMFETDLKNVTNMAHSEMNQVLPSSVIKKVQNDLLLSRQVSNTVLPGTLKSPAFSENHYTNLTQFETENALAIVKAKKYLNEKGVDVARLDNNELVEAADLTRAMLNETQTSRASTKEDDELVKEFKAFF